MAGSSKSPSCLQGLGLFWALLFAAIALIPHLSDQTSKFPTDMHPSRHVVLHDGRNLSFLEYGDPNGFPVFVLQSFLQGRTSHTPQCEEVDRLRKARVIVIDRPGYGTSTPAPWNYTLEQLSVDLVQVADHLGIDQFGIVGISAGAVYALAATNVIPPSRLVSVFLLSPAHPDPYQENREDCDIPAFDGLKYIGYQLPFLPRIIFDLFRWWCAFKFPEDAFPPSVIGHAFTVDEINHLKTQGSWTVLTESCMESIRAGVDGVLTDLKLISMQWTYRIDKINRNPNEMYNIHMFHGEEDSIVGVGCARHYESIPNIKYTYCEGCGHGVLGNETVWDHVLTSILADRVGL